MATSVMQGCLMSYLKNEERSAVYAKSAQGNPKLCTRGCVRVGVHNFGYPLNFLIF